MALLRAHTTRFFPPPALHSSSLQRPVQVYRFRCCAVGNGGFDGDGGKLLAASERGTPSTNPSNKKYVAEADDSGSREETWAVRAESTIERAIFNFRFLTLMAIAGSLVGSLLCFLKGCGFVIESFVAYFKMCLNGRHTGKVILRLVEAVDVYLVGTVMLIFGMGLYGLFISNCAEPLEEQNDRALQNTTLFGMFPLKKRPLWMRITTLDTLKTKLGHVIVMILLVKLFERSKTVHISSSTDLLFYSFSIFLSSAALYVLQRLHAS